MYTKNWKSDVRTRLSIIILYFHFVQGLTIDNQLTVIRNDCYERLAIGEKINRKDIDKTLTLKTVQECQLACTQEEEKCRTFSFGIGVKGNGTCELSKTVIKETPDLKPIGTVSDVEFDLYIKKLGCKLVLPKDPPDSNIKPLPETPSSYGEDKPQEKPVYPTKPSDNYGQSKPPSHNNDYKKPPYYGSVRPTYAPERPYQDNSAGPNYNLGKPFRVQSSLIGVASNPNVPSRPSVPYLEKDDNDRPPSRYGIGRPYYPNRFSNSDFDRPSYYYDFRGDRPPFRPPILNHPYDDWYDREPHFHDRFDSLYGHGSQPHRPNDIPDRPGLDDYEQKPHRPDFIPEAPFGYGSSSNRPPFIPERPYLDVRPRPERPPENDSPYGSRPQRPHDIPERPSNYYEYGPERPLSDSGNYGSRPNRPYEVPQRPGGDGYGQASRPQRPDEIPNRPLSDSGSYGSRPHRPQEIPLRPIENLDDYEQVTRPHRPPQRPDRPIGSYENRPHRPDVVPDRPLGGSDGYGQGSRPHRPDTVPERPLGDVGGYGQGSRPHRPDIAPERPLGDVGGYGQGSRPHRPEIAPERPLGDVGGYGQGSRPYRPEIVPERPLGDIGGYGQGSRPHRPDIVPERPLGDVGGYGQGSRPHRPEIVPERPLGDVGGYGQGSRPHRPEIVPERPLGDIGGYGQDSRPHRPDIVPHRPLDVFGGYGQGPRPHRPDIVPERPFDNPDGYGQGSRPHRPHDIPERPFDDIYGPRPHRPQNRPDYDQGLRPQRPQEISERPPGNLEYGGSSKPYRPFNIPSRPISSSDNYGSRPYRPDRIPDRPYDSNLYNEPYYDDPGYGYGRPYYRLKRPRPVRPLDYETDYERPIFVPINPSYNYGRIKSNEDTNLVQNVSNGSNHSVLNNTSSSNSSNGIESNLIEKSEGAKNPHRKPIVSESLGPYGETITSIITEIAEACFRRVLAGKRMLRAFVRKAVPCERVEDCQRECSDEKRFVCEGFNYRLDPSGRGQGDCELLDLPLSRFDIRRDVYDDPDYDYYERDRNSDAPDCKGHRYYGSHGNGGGITDNNSYGGGGAGGGGSYYYADNGYDYDYRNRQGGYDDDAYRGHGYRQPRPGQYDDGYKTYDDNRRGDYDYRHHSQDGYEKSYGYHYKDHFSGSSGYDYEHSSHGYQDPGPGYGPPRDNEYKPHYPPPPYDHKSYEPYLPHGYWKYERPFHDSNGYWNKYFEDRVKDKDYWGFSKHYGGWGSYGGSYGNFGAPDSYYAYDHYNDHRNTNRYDYDTYDKKYFYAPPDDNESKDWGRYGGSYGNGGQRWDYNNHREGYDYWGLNKLDGGRDYGNKNTGLLPPYQEKPDLNGPYLPPYEDGDYFGIRRHNEHDYDHFGHHGYHYGHDSSNSLKDECSLRMVTGFRLHKGIVKKFTAVPNIYECELLCFKERDFPCNSYAFRYTSIPNAAPENCYLSDRDYRELDYYTDLEPDRDCDIYTMNNQNKCDQTTHLERYNSECFWRVRSGQRLDQRIVKDSLNVKTIVECQLECLRSHMFTCRSFSFRYGSPIIGGAIDNCQLTDWPFLDLDPRIHLVPEDGFELYERGSYGHGCEPNHFHIGNKPNRNPGEKFDQLCYIGYGSPARLLPPATKKTLRVETEAECKAECTQAREKSLFQCMSLSYRTSAPKGSPNCDLSDIVQRDLLSNVDYIADPDSWLFAWDIHSPRCIAVISVITIGSGGGGGNGIGGGSVIGGGGGIHGGGGGINGGGGVIHGGGGGIHGGGGVGGGIGGTDGPYDHGKGGVIVPWLYPGYTWRIYSVGGMPCKKGSLCQENKVAGFWYCELEGREEHAWDYCCRPDHQCGYSEGFPYQWCHVGPGRTQWRKCNDRYYPYQNNGGNDRFDQHQSGHYLPDVSHSSQAWGPSDPIGSNHVSDVPPPPFRPGFRPDRPHPSQPSLDDYDSHFNNHFLDPPKPGGFGSSRHWPISYLHKEMPPNDTFSDSNLDYAKVPKGRNIESKYDAIANLINVIKSNDVKNLQYSIANDSSKPDEVLYVQIPLPTNFSAELKSEKLVQENGTNKSEKMETEDLLFPEETSTSKDIVDIRHGNIPNNHNFTNTNTTNRKQRAYTRSYITKTNRTVSNERRTRGIVQLLPPLF